MLCYVNKAMIYNKLISAKTNHPKSSPLYNMLYAYQISYELLDVSNLLF